MSAAPYFKSEHWDATFELGLRAMMDAFARNAPSRPAAKKTRSRAPPR
jgi:hypothetical protein